MSILIAYATTHGHTGRIARRIADVLSAEGLDVEVGEVTRHGPDPLLAGHETVVVGASLHAGHHQRGMMHWLREHQIALTARSTALFSVSLTAAEDSEEARATTQQCVDDLLEETHWRPDVVATFAGALQYQEYDVFTRVLMRLIARYHGMPTDVGADVDLTDWDAVERFAHEIAAGVRAAAAARTSNG